MGGLSLVAVLSASILPSALYFVSRGKARGADQGFEWVGRAVRSLVWRAVMESAYRIGSL